MIDLGRFDDTPFFSIFRPFLEFIGEGKHFSILYSIIHFAMAILNLLLPFVILYKAIDSRIFSFGAKYGFAFVLMWLIIAFACWIGLQFWWDRRRKATELGSPEFIAMPFFSGILQTFGECVGIEIGIIGAGGGLLASIFLGRDVNYLFSMIGLNFMRYGVAVIIIGPIIGIVTMLIFRFIAELIRVLAAIANR